MNAELTQSVVDALTALSDVTVSVGEVAPEPCSCGEGGVAAVRVYGEPWDECDDVAPVPSEGVEVCAGCAVEVALRAVSEQDPWSRKPIRIEVAPWTS